MILWDELELVSKEIEANNKVKQLELLKKLAKEIQRKKFESEDNHE